MRLLHLLTCIAYLKLCSSNYEYFCPTALNWPIRSRALCTTTKKYSCLHDENTDTFREICRERPSILAPGNKYVIRGNLDGEDCNGNQYQPFIFQTSKHNECAIKKSKCNEAGQIKYSNGSATEDKSCRCDYSKSYAPIHKPSNPCYCVPSKEDCSCYLKICPEKNHLSSEYTCVSDYTLRTLDNCGSIPLSESEESSIIWAIKQNEDKVTFKSERFDDVFLVARITCLTVLAGLLLAAIVCIISDIEDKHLGSESKKQLSEDINKDQNIEDEHLGSESKKKSSEDINKDQNFEDEHFGSEMYKKSTRDINKDLTDVKDTQNESETISDGGFNGDEHVKDTQNESETIPDGGFNGDEHFRDAQVASEITSDDGIKRYESSKQKQVKSVINTGSTFSVLDEFKDYLDYNKFCAIDLIDSATDTETETEFKDDFDYNKFCDIDMIDSATDTETETGYVAKKGIVRRLTRNENSEDNIFESFTYIIMKRHKRKSDPDIHFHDSTTDNITNEVKQKKRLSDPLKVVNNDDLTITYTVINSLASLWNGVKRVLDENMGDPDYDNGKQSTTLDASGV